MLKKGTTRLSSKFQIAESRTFEKTKKKLAPKLYEKIRNVVYPQLRANPCFGPNIKKMRGELERYYRYRIGHYRLLYLIEDDKVLVIIVHLKHRQRAHE